jgi:hypothetical protein
MSKTSKLVALGLRAKTGRAIVVVLGGAAESPTVLMKTEIQTSDPKIPETAQPYHHVMDLPPEEWEPAVRQFARAIEKVAARALAQLIKQQQANGLEVAGVGIIGAADRNLTRIGSSHIRAHAAEGILFRRVLDLASAANGLKWKAFPERQFDQIVSAEVGNAVSLRKKISELRRSVPSPWRMDEKQAATAAWLVLHGKSATRV